MDIALVILSVIVVFLLVNTFVVKEFFSASNSDYIKDSTYSLYEVQLRTLSDLVRSVKDPLDIVLFTSDYQASYFFNKEFTESVVSHINSKVANNDVFKNYKFKASSETIKNVMSYDTEGSRYFKFDIDLHNDPNIIDRQTNKEKTFQPFFVKLKVTIQLKNIERYLLPDGKYQVIIPLEPNDVIIHDIQIRYDELSTSSNFKAANSQSTLSQIRARLFIIDPNAVDI